MARGQVLELVLDYPRAAEAEGYCVAEVNALGGMWRMRIEK